MIRREFKLVEGSSSKFWAIELNEKSFSVHYGRIGTDGQKNTKNFPDEVAALSEYEKLVREKTRKGYKEDSAKPGPTTSRKADEKVESNPAVKVVSEPASPTPKSKSASVIKREIALDPLDRLFVTWEDHEPMEGPVPAPFDRSDALKRLRSLGDHPGTWTFRWNRAKIPEVPSAEEASFWILVYGMAEDGKLTPAQIAERLSKRDLELSVESIAKICSGRRFGGIDNLVNCIFALAEPEDILTRDLGQSDSSIGESFRRFVLPYLGKQRKESLRKLAVKAVKPGIPPSMDLWPNSYRIAPLLGCHEALARLVRSIPDNHYGKIKQSPSLDHYYQPQWLFFGLRDPYLIRSEFRRVGLWLRDKAQARAWLALTEYEGLEQFAAMLCQTPSKEIATELASVLLLVSAPEASAPSLQIQLESKAPQVGVEWLKLHPLEAGVGLVPTAMGKGKFAAAAKEQLRQLVAEESLQAAILKNITPEEAIWTRREIIDPVRTELAVPILKLDKLPPALSKTLRSQKVASLPDWLDVKLLPSIKLSGGKLSPEDASKVLSALQQSSPDERSPLIAALKTTADGAGLDGFAWRLFGLWMEQGAAPRDRWALEAVGHLGNDTSVSRLTPLVREWPGQSQHPRAVCGLQCLRAIGTDAALLALNGIAQKLKFKALKEKAQELIREIAAARGLTGDELADRLVPDCGLDDDGNKVFDFGTRQFQLVLGPQMQLLLRDDGGKLITDLPAPKKTDDAAKTDAAVADWKQFRKAIRETLSIQAARLEDVMVTGRQWTLPEFETLFLSQPLMFYLIRQPVLSSTDGSKTPVNFRVTEDKTFAGMDDEPVKLPPTSRIGIVHPLRLSEKQKAIWGQLLSDYKIAPPFSQLGRPVFSSDSADLKKTEITRFRGPKIDAKVMYGVLDRSRWLKDTPADAGSFMQHSRYFPGAEVTAFIQYNGMSMGYMVESQEIQSIYFVPGHVKPKSRGQHKNRLKIKDVDEVVMSEVLRTAHDILSKAE